MTDPKTATDLLAETPAPERAKTLQLTVYLPMPAAWVGTAANDNEEALERAQEWIDNGCPNSTYGESCDCPDCNPTLPGVP